MNYGAGTVAVTASDTASDEHFDFDAVIQISQGLFAEADVDKLIDRFMRAAIEQGYAQRAVIVAIRGEELRTSAEAIVHEGEVSVKVRPHPSADPVALPLSLVL